VSIMACNGGWLRIVPCKLPGSALLLQDQRQRRRILAGEVADHDRVSSRGQVRQHKSREIRLAPNSAQEFRASDGRGAGRVEQVLVLDHQVGGRISRLVVYDGLLNSAEIRRQRRDGILLEREKVSLLHLLKHLVRG